MRTFLVVSSVCLALGCNGTTNPVDAGGGGDTGGHDAGGGADDAGDDAAITPDAGGDAASGCATSCSGDHACVRGVCIATCGADASAFEGALASGLVVVGSVCRVPAAMTFVNGRVYDVMTSSSGGVTTFTLSRWTPGSESPTLSLLATAMYTAPAGDSVFPGGYVAVSPDEMHAVFGFTTSPSMVGGVFDVATGTGSAAQLGAENNFDATFLDATDYVVDGAPGGMQGLYRAAPGDTAFTQVASHFGDYSGSVELWAEEGVVLAGGSSFGFVWADGAPSGDRVLVFDPAALVAATTPIDGATVQQLVMPSGFELLPGARAATLHWGATGLDAIQVRTLTRDTAGVVTASAATDLTTGGAFTSVSAAGTDIALGFEGGLLFVH